MAFRVVLATGDGRLSQFDSTADAVTAALAAQAAAGSTARIGIDAGEAAETDRAATALSDRARPGEILVSEVVRSLAGERLAHRLHPRGDAWAIGEQGIRVVIVDDQALVRKGFRVILDSEPGFVVAGEAGDGDEALDVVTRLQPDVVLMDIRMPRVSGLDAARAILERTASRVVILTTFDADEYVYRAVRMGASGFLLKDAPPERLFAPVRCAHSGEALIDPAITQRLIAGFARPAAEPLPELTGREAEVLRLMAKGSSNAEIAAGLFVEESTVKTHVARILVKLGARDRLQAVVRAYESGFVRAGFSPEDDPDPPRG